jgi:hypothetical protein
MNGAGSGRQRGNRMNDNTEVQAVKLDGLVKPLTYNEYGWGFCPAVGATRKDRHAKRVASILAALDTDAIAALVGAVQKEADALRVLVAGLEPSRQAALEAGGEPITYGERLWAVSMRIDTALARLGGGE